MNWSNVAALKQWSSSRVSWWSGHWVFGDYIWKALYFADQCLHQRKWGWKNYWKRDEVSFVVWSYQRFSSLCYIMESQGDHVSIFFGNNHGLVPSYISILYIYIYLQNANMLLYLKLNSLKRNKCRKIDKLFIYIAFELWWNS